MSKLTDKNVLVPLLLLLLLARFVVVPVIEWQNARWQSLQVLEKQLAKANNVLSRGEQYQQTLDALKATNDELLKHYYQQNNVNALKLSFQQELEQLVKKHNVTIRNFNWPNELPGDITKLSAQLTVAGKTRDVASLHLDLVQHAKLIQVERFNLVIKKMKTGSLGEVSGNLLLTIYSTTPEEEKSDV